MMKDKINDIYENSKLKFIIIKNKRCLKAFFIIFILISLKNKKTVVFIKFEKFSQF